MNEFVADINAAEKRAALKRVLESAEFSGTARAREFLAYVVEEEVAGRSERLKGYTIATEALGRNDAFNADVQSAVRVQAKRLREQLEAYYRGSGRDDDIIIDIPRGGYVPIFQRRGRGCGPEPAQQKAQDDPEQRAGGVVPADASLTAPAAPAPQTPPAPQPADTRRRRNLVLLALALAASLLAIYVTTVLQAPTQLTGVPTLFIVLPEKLPDARLQAIAERYTFALKTRLSSFDDVSVTDERPASGGFYEVELGYFANRDGTVDAVVQIDNMRDEQLFSQENVIGADEREDMRVVGELAAKIAAPYGVVYSDVVAQPLGGEQKCVIGVFEYFRNGRAGDLPAIEQCLRKAIAERPRSMRALVALSRVLIEQYRLALTRPGQADPLAEADALATRALEAAPQRGRPIRAIAEVRFFQKRYDEAFEAAERALAINPNTPVFLYRLGAGRILRGDFEQGRALFERARKMNAVPPAWTQFFFFLEALHRGDEAAAARAALAPGTEATAPGLLARAALAQRRKEPEEKRKYLEALARDYPKFAADLSGSLDRIGFAAPVKKLLALAD